jgi:hypothetical protein
VAKFVSLYFLPEFSALVHAESRDKRVSEAIIAFSETSGMHFSPMFLAAIAPVPVTNRLGFGYMYPAMGADHHSGHGRFI